MFKSDLNTIRPRKMGNNNAIQSISNRSFIKPKTFLNNRHYYESDKPKYDNYFLPVGMSMIPVTKSIKTRETRCTSFWRSLKTYAQEYCSGTSLHGLKYIGAEAVSVIERIFWICSFLIAVGFAAFFINNVYMKWTLSPVIVGVNPEFTSISSIPFPAITICNMNQVKKIPVTKSIKTRETRCTSFWRSLKTYAQEYCSGTSLHGLKYIGAEAVSVIERIFWICSFLIAVGFAAFFINNVYMKWTLSPVIVGVNPEFTSISSIPFPAITICNMNQVKKSVAKDILLYGSEVELLLLEDLCHSSNSSNFQNSTDDGVSNWKTVKNFVLKVSQPCSELIVYCQWQGQTTPCGNIINPVFTDEGVCCTFNRVANEYMFNNPLELGDFNITFPPNNIDWKPEEGYPFNISRDTWPYRPEGAGSHLGLTVVTDVNAKDYYCSSTNSVGLKVRLHSPVESPLIADFGFFLHPRKENRIAIFPYVDEASPTIYNIPIEKRQCLFSSERELYFYRTYTKINCEMECLANYTLKQCSCVPYYMPKNIRTKICGKKKELCYQQARAYMETSLNTEIYCNCLPSCYEISYNADVSIGDISNPHVRKSYTTATELTDLIVTHFYFPSTQFRTFQKSELFGFTEFLANSGGLLGLFLGFSFLSAVELGYHLTLKILCVYYRKQSNIQVENVIYPFTK